MDAQEKRPEHASNGRPSHSEEHNPANLNYYRDSSIAGIGGYEHDPGPFRKKKRTTCACGCSGYVGFACPIARYAAPGSSSTTTCKPDFTITISPATLTIVNGGPAAFIGVGFKSLCGLAGTINFGVRGITPQPTSTCDKGACTSNGPIFQQCCYDLPLKADGSTGNHITASATQSTRATTYQVKITGRNIQGGCCYGITHSANVTLTVASCCVASFTIAANPTSITVPAGQTASSAIIATGTNGFSGTIYYSTTISGGFCSTSTYCSDSCPIQPWNPTLSPTVTSVTSTLSCTFDPSLIPKGTYTVFVTTNCYCGLPSRNATITITET
jgi:hypothetical protein